MTLSQLVANLQSTIDGVEDAERLRKAAETRLLDLLAAIGKPLNVGCSVVIGDVMVNRHVQDYMPLDVVAVCNLSPDTVVVAE